MVLRLRGAGGIILETQDGKVFQMSLDGNVEELKWKLSERLNVPFANLTIVASDGQSPKDGELHA
jgi:hypothetical protein